MARQIDLGQELDNIITVIRGEYEDVLKVEPRFIWSRLIDSSDIESCDKIIVAPSQIFLGLVAYS